MLLIARAHSKGGEHNLCTWPAFSTSGELHVHRPPVQAMLLLQSLEL